MYILPFKERHSKYWEEEVPLYDEAKFKEEFRVSRRLFDELVTQLWFLEREDTHMRCAIPLKKRIAIALYALGSSAEYRTVASVFGVGRTTVGEIVLDVCEAIVSTMQRKYIDGYPPNEAKIESTVAGFEALGFPQCYGAIGNLPNELIVVITYI